MHADYAQQAQQGRGRGSRELLLELTVPDLREMNSWQLEAAEAIWRDFANREFESFHRCAIDPPRIELDRRVVREMLGLNGDAEDTVKRLRLLLASEPSIHGAKKPELPTGEDY
jgi:hypothetical protein